jgi:uncharacterized protein (TIRG00374 family)
MNNKPIFTYLRIGVSLFLVGLIVWFMRDKNAEIIKVIRDANIKYLLIGLLVFLIATFILAFRLIKVVSVQGIRLSLKEATYLTFMGYFFNNFFPTSFGGDVVKAYYIGKKSKKKAAAFSSVFMDRLLAMLPFTAMPAVTIFLCGQKLENKSLTIAVYALFAACLFITFFLLNRGSVKVLSALLSPFKGELWHNKLKDLYSYLNKYSQHRFILAWSFMLSTFAQAISIIAVYLFSRAVGANDISLSVFFIIFPIVSVMTILPSLNGLGIREGGFVYFFKNYMLSEQALAVSLLVLAYLMFLSIIGGLIYVFKKSSFAFKEEGF